MKFRSLLHFIGNRKNLSIQQCCKDESWINIAKYLKEDVPRLVSSQHVDSVEKIISVVFKSLPSNFNTFIRWVAEIRITEDAKENLSAEEKSRLNLKAYIPFPCFGLSVLFLWTIFDSYMSGLLLIYCSKWC